MIDKTLIIVCGTLQQGGAERIISVLSKEFLNYFENVKIVLWRGGPVFYSIADNIEIVFIPEQSKRNSLIGQMLWFRKYAKHLKPYAVLSFLAPFNMLSLVALLGARIPVYIASRSAPFYDAPNKYWRWTRDCIYHFATKISVQSEENKKYFSKSLQKKISVIYNPVFVEPQLIGMALRSPKLPVIVSVGRLSRSKNQELLLNVFKEIHHNYPDYRCIIYGEGEYRNILEGKIRDLKLEEYVTLPGACKEVLTKILSAEIFVMTSDYEGMSNALIEAMVLGLPSISTCVSGANDLIENNMNGKLIAIGDATGLKSALEDWLKNKDRANECALHGIKLASQLQLEEIVKQWLIFMDVNIEI